MTNNHDDFEQQDLPPEEAPPKAGIGANLANAWRSQPLFKLFILMVAVAAVVAVSVSFFSGSTRTNVASMVKPPEMHEAPGGKASPYMKEQTELANSERMQEAIKNGGSALPTPIGQTNDNNFTGGNRMELNELQAEVESLNKQLQQRQVQPPPSTQPKQQQQQAQVQQQQVQQQQQFDDNLAQAMQRQMAQLLDGWTVRGVKDVPGLKPEITDAKKSAAEVAQAQANAAATRGPRSSSRPAP